MLLLLKGAKDETRRYKKKGSIKRFLTNIETEWIRKKKEETDDDDNEESYGAGCRRAIVTS